VAAKLTNTAEVVVADSSQFTEVWLHCHFRVNQNAEVSYNLSIVYIQLILINELNFLLSLCV
jgi:hypothetical protein